MTESPIELSIFREIADGSKHEHFRGIPLNIESKQEDNVETTKNNLPINLTQRPFVCSCCYFTCDSFLELNSHIEQCHRYSCKICEKTFSTGSGLYSHNRMHHGTGTDLLECKICGKKCLSKARLQIHERSHSENRMFQCLQCNKSYKHKYSLDGHNCVGLSETKQ